MRICRSLICVAVMIVAPRSALTAPSGSLPEPIAWRQNAFSIPFNVAPAQSPEQQPREIRLYVSVDRGAKWDLAQTVQATANSFVFRSTADGEYWFIIRTVDQQGRVSPEVSGQPELRVIVDTMPPRLELTAARGEAGEIKTQWRAVDPLLNSDTLKIEYQTTAGAWRPVATDRPRADGERNTTAGTLTWWPSDAPAVVSIRGEISDRAGNVALSQAKAEAAAPRIGQDLTARNASPPQGQSPPATPAVIAQGPAPWPATQSTDMPLGHDANGRGAAVQQQQQPRRPPWEQTAVAAAQPDRGWEDPGNPAIQSRPQSGKPSPTAESSTPRDAQQSRNTRPAVDGPPAGEHPRMVNSKSFEMDYEVDAVGPSGVAKVELWGTRDGGRTWTSYGLDNDNRTPICAVVDGEGVYGFCISVQSGNGLGGLPPRRGESPEVWVGVDLTPPKARLISAKAGAGERAGELLITWEAGDDTLSVRPITLLFSEKPGGPWSIIAAGLENTGQYAWRPDNRVPDRIFIRIEARDEAGNTASHEPSEPVEIQQVRPEGRIQGVRPLNDAARRPQMYQYYR